MSIHNFTQFPIPAKQITATDVPFGNTDVGSELGRLDGKFGDYRTASAQDVIDNAQNTALQPLINQWDEQYNFLANNTIQAKNNIKILPNTKYYLHSPTNIKAYYYAQNGSEIQTEVTITHNTEFTTPANAYYLGWYSTSYGTTYNNDISINYPSSYTGYYPSALPKTNAHIGGLGNVIGMRGWNQLLPISSQPSVTRGGITFTNNGDGSITLNGTSSDTDSTYFQISTNYSYATNSHKFMLISGDDDVRLFCSSSTWTTYFYEFGSAIITSTDFNIAYINIYVRTGASYSNKRIYPMLIDLTLLFGSGNEPSSVSDFRAMFGAGYYPYCQGGFADLLWTNASQTSSFPSQTLSMDLSEYKYVLVKYKDVVNGSYYIFGIVNRATIGNCLLHTTVWSGSENGMAVRGANINQTVGLYFASGYYASTYKSFVSNNDYIIPVEVYGIR